jgi:hypothetical protein
MKYIDSITKMEIARTLLYYNECYVWYNNDKKKFEVEVHTILTATSQNREFIKTFYSKNIYTNQEKRNEMEKELNIIERKIYEVALEKL